MPDKIGMFRAKKTDDGQTVEGYYVCLNGTEHRIYCGCVEVDCDDYYPDWSEIDPNTLEYLGNQEGCDFCNEPYVVMSGGQMNKDAMYKRCTAKFCPNCGGKLLKGKDE